MPRSPLVPNTQGVRVTPSYVLHIGGHLGTLGILWTVLLVILWAVAVTVLVLVAITLVKGLSRSQTGEPLPASPADTAPLVAPPVTSDALRLLDERFARGEIGREEYAERKELLTGS